MENYWIAFYQYPKFYLNISYGEFDEILDLWDNIGQSCGWWYPFENIVLVSDHPLEIHKNIQGQLHADGKPALLFRDGYCLWMLNGVAVPRDYVLTPAEKMNADLILKEKNAQVKMELIKKIGYERILKDLHADKLDTWREYELLKIERNIDVEPIVLVKMACPSTGAFYALRVPPQTKTCREGVMWINHGVDPGNFLVET